jgi:hypothetical protein
VLDFQIVDDNFSDYRANGNGDIRHGIGVVIEHDEIKKDEEQVHEDFIFINSDVDENIQKEEEN